MSRILNLSAKVDTSFLINMHILGLFDLLCEEYEELIVTPSVWDESIELLSMLLKLKCLKQTKLKQHEQEEVDRLHKVFIQSKNCLKLKKLI